MPTFLVHGVVHVHFKHLDSGLMILCPLTVSLEPFALLIYLPGHSQNETIQ